MNNKRIAALLATAPSTWQFTKVVTGAEVIAREEAGGVEDLVVRLSYNHPLLVGSFDVEVTIEAECTMLVMNTPLGPGELTRLHRALGALATWQDALDEAIFG